MREHVVCKEFFLESDRGNLPMVPACEECNTRKSKLETYALTVLPFGSLHEDSAGYLEKNAPRRLRKNPTLNRQLAEGATRVWGKHGEVLMPTTVLPVDDERIDKLMAMIVRGLYMHHFELALNKNWDVMVTMFRPEREVVIMDQVKVLLGEDPRHISLNLGRGTFTYEGYCSSIMRNLSVWQFTLFGGLALADDEIALSRFSAITSRKDDVQGPLGDKELSIGN